MIKATVSGSFHHHMQAIYEAVGELRELRVDVLSPSDPRVVDHIGQFLFVASDKIRAKKLVQRRHFDAIDHSDFLWLVCPDGYTGVSVSMEIGWALKAGTPVYATRAPSDITAEDFVTVVPSMKHAVAAAMSNRRSRTRTSGMLIDPVSVARDVVRAVEETQTVLTGQAMLSPEEASRVVRKNAKIVSGAFDAMQQ